jgi:hypothetical protein
MLPENLKKNVYFEVFEFSVLCMSIKSNLLKMSIFNLFFYMVVLSAAERNVFNSPIYCEVIYFSFVFLLL